MISFFRSGAAAVCAAAFAVAAHATDMTWTFAVQINASVATDPARIELSWPSDPFPIVSYSVHRKAVTDTAWGEPVVLPGDASGFADENVESGRVYEYQVVKRAVSYTGYGYIAVGLNAPVVHSRGRVILLVDSVFAEPLAGELARLQADLAGDGWTVARYDVARSDTPEDVKAVIRRDYEANKDTAAALFLLGRIPIVRSGNLNVDGHGSRPMPADTFYADVDGVWTDANGDGIYDQNQIPSSVELQVGRVDFADLPGKFSPFPYPSETELMKRYLDKNHAFRIAAVRPRQRAIVGGLSDANGQAYAAAAFRNFAALVGNGNVSLARTEVDAPVGDRWISRISADDYLWAFGGGAGSDFTVGGLGRHGAYLDLWASDFMEQKAKASFYMLFGSWFSDWTKSDNILRTALTSPEHGLGAAWSGRPHLFFHHMGVGEPIGYGLRLSQNNAGLYQNQVQRQLRGVHIALLGDPTLRMHAVAPPTEAKATAESSGALVVWKASPDKVVGYHVYRGASADGPFTRLTDEPVNDTRFADLRRPSETSIYLVRAVALVTSSSGSFYNASQGAFATLPGAGSASVQTTPVSEPRTPDTPRSTDLVWLEDALPEGAEAGAELDRWNWVTENPAPFSGARAHQADVAPGRHHHFFGGARTALDVASGDTLFVYVYLDPANPPRQLMLTWLADDWEHRAYWGENLIDEGTDGTASRRRIGDLPPLGRWTRIEVPASAVGLENRHVTGMGFTLFDGRATWDRAGKSRP